MRRSSSRSLRPFQETQAPIVAREGLIYVKATIDGKQVEGMLDTGSPDTTWPAPLALAPNNLLSAKGRQDWIGTSGVPSNSVLLPTLTIGDYTVENLISWKQNFDTRKMSALYRKQNRTYRQPYVVLGNSTFHNAIITIDYENNLFIVRDSSYDLHNDKTDFILPFLMENGHILVQGEIEGKAATLCVDTGASLIFVASEFDDNNLASRLSKRSGHNVGEISSNYGGESMPFAGMVSGSIGNEPFRAAAVLDKTHGDSDAVIGSSVLDKYQITIDYSRNLIGFRRQNPKHVTPAGALR